MQCTYHSGSVQHSAPITVGQYSTVYVSQWVSTAQCTYLSAIKTLCNIKAELHIIKLQYVKKKLQLGLSFGAYSSSIVECIPIIQFLTCPPDIKQITHPLKPHLDNL